MNHEYTEEITCPWCGYIQGESWELKADYDEDICEECGNTYTYERFVEVTYTTYKKKDK